MTLARPLQGLVLVLMAALTPSAALAFETIELYSAERFVADQSREARKQAAQTALAQLIVRVSGSPESLEAESIQAALKRADRYLLEFRYGARVSRENEQGESQRLLPLVMQFSESAVEKLLRQAQLPLWPENRPELLLWVVVDDGEQSRQLLAAPERRDQVALSAKTLGLAIDWPLADLEDQLVLSVEDLWSQELAMISQASERYSADYLIAGRMFKTSSGQWFGNWQMLPDSRLKGASTIAEIGAEFEADSDRDLLDQAMTWVAQQLAARYAIVPRSEDDGATYLQVTGINNFDRYARLLANLQALPMVASADVLQVAGEELIVKLATDGDLSQFQRALNRKMPLIWANQPQEFMPVIATSAQPLHYHWALTDAEDEVIPALRLSLPQAPITDDVPPVDADDVGAVDTNDSEADVIAPEMKDARVDERLKTAEPAE